MSAINQTSMTIPKQRKPPLSDFERGKVIAYRDCHLTHQEISRRLDRSYSCVQRFVKQLEKPVLPPPPPPPSIMKKRKSKLNDRFTTRIKLSLKRNPNQPLEYHLNQIRIEGFDVSLNTLNAQLRRMGLCQYT